MRRMLLLLTLLICSQTFAQTDTLTVVAYNLLNFPNGRDDCGTNTVVPNRADTLRKILSYDQPDIFVACEIQTEAGADSVLTRSLNYNGISNYASANYHNNSTGGNLQNQLYYNTDKLTLVSQDYIATGVRDIDHYVLYANDPNLGVYFDTTFLEVYMCHLKAGNSSSNAGIRADQTQLLMEYIATRPTDHHHVVCGDFNVYTSSELGYSQMTSGPIGLVDPINTPGSWNNNGTYASIHTQSTRSSLNFDCGSKGGSDDRFDQILVSSNVMSGSDSVEYISGSYEALGNDGNHYNTNLLNGPNSQYPDSLVKALYYMSDHLPVSMDVVLRYPTSNGLALYPQVSAASCHGANDGEATIVANDGQPPYTYQWDAAAGNQTTSTATGLASGSYCVQVMDALGEVDSYCVFVGQPGPITANTFLFSDGGGCDGEVYLLVEGGTEPYSITWNDPLQQTGTHADSLCAGDYVATITDASGCQVLDTVTIQTAGIEELLKEISIAPNPMQNVLTIDFGAAQVSHLNLRNLIGQSVLELNTEDMSAVKLDTQNLISGIYLLELQLLELDQTATIRVLKQ